MNSSVRTDRTTCLLAWTMIVLMLTAAARMDGASPPYLGPIIYEPYTFTTLAGNAGYGSADGTGSAARFRGPQGVAVDSVGNVYVGDTANETIRKVTPEGVVTTLAGGPAGENGHVDGTGSAARFFSPSGVAVDSAGNVYVADAGTVRKVTPTGAVTTLAGRFDGPSSGADGTGSAAQFGRPIGVAVDGAGNVYVTDSSAHTLRKVTATGVVTTLAGLAQFDAFGHPVFGSADGTGSAARFYYPSGVAVDSVGNVYIGDSGNHTIRKVTPAGVVTTLAGLAGSRGSEDGTGSDARFHTPTGVTVDSTGTVYVADHFNHTIRKVTPAGVVTTMVGLKENAGGMDGTGSDARFNLPFGVAADSAGNVFVGDQGNDTIRKVTPSEIVTTLAGSFGGADGTGSAARFAGPSGVAVDSARTVYVADSGNHTIRKVTPTGVVTTLAGSAGSSGSADGTGNAGRFRFPQGVAVDSVGNLYVSDTLNHTIRMVTPQGVVTTLAGLAGSVGNADGAGRDARFNVPVGLAVDSAGTVYVADDYNSSIRKVTPTGVVTTIAGLAEGFIQPTGVAVDSAGNVYVSDIGANAIRKMTPSGEVAALVGFASPAGVAVDSSGNVYATEFDFDWGISTIRKVTPTGMVTILVGIARGSADGTGSDALFNIPFGVAVDGAGNVYVADTLNDTIRKGYPAPRILNSGPGFGFFGGQFSFNLTGPAGHSVVVEVSPDLVNWLALWTNTYTFPAALSFSESQNGVSSQRFYRARLP